ncbi:hypothetical protein MKQ68_03580 [Chitinophaga horti]|uniref:Uncharacterized protein n=1 Tax=Chitinophaga horti TaxID=2920382 RepID=A0ABY6J471_9BACT|nr:hypothetical protein [Chitinophaga horti]UYQ94171.1 hypothetical protein MKQ68_03580 [Chitinophaga horti]
MIQQDFNAISTGATGMFGKQVVMYMRYGKKIVAKAPRKRPGKGTPNQERTKADFTKAAGWSARVRANADLNARYKAGLTGGKNVHNLAIADYLVAPVIHGATVVKGRVIIHATDNFRVASVKVMVYHANGDLLEAGLAAEGASGQWTYSPLSLPAGCSIVVVATDLPGNECRYECTLPQNGQPAWRVTMVRVACREVVHDGVVETG